MALDALAEERDDRGTGASRDRAFAARGGDQLPLADEALRRARRGRRGDVLARGRHGHRLSRPNGAGKTTTLRLLLGLAEPTSGEALVFGHRYRELEQPIRRVGAVLESADFHPARSGRNHLGTLALAAGLPPSRVGEVLELVELRGAAGRRVRTYSLGMRQRLGLAAALLGDPELLILDEPANGLDPAGVRWLRTFLQKLAAQGRTVLVSSHLLAEVAQTVDRVLIIDHGRLLASGRLDELTRGTTKAWRTSTSS
jgi:ABC-2 type transport system ATP-binding protein